MLYADYRFDWGPKMVGYTLAGVGILSVIVQGGLIKRFIARFGERKTLLLGLAFGAAGFLLYGLAPSGAWFWAAMPIAALWGIATPAAQSLMTRQVAPNEQGRLQGAIVSLSSVAGILGPTIFTRAFSDAAGRGPDNAWVGITFWLAAAMLLTGLWLAWRATRLASEATPPA